MNTSASRSIDYPLEPGHTISPVSVSKGRCSVARFEKLRAWIAQTVIVMEGWSAQAERTRVSAGFGTMVQLCYFSRFCV